MAIKPMMTSRRGGLRKTGPSTACFSASIVWLRIAADIAMTIPRTTNCWKTEKPAHSAIAVEKAPMNEPTLQLP